MAKTDQELAQQALDAKGIPWRIQDRLSLENRTRVNPIGRQQLRAPERSINPFNPAFRSTVGSTLRQLVGDSGLGGEAGGRTGLYDLAQNTEALLDFIPVLDVGLGAGDTLESYRQGDLIGTGVNAAATAMGVIPMAGDAAAAALKKGYSSLRNIGGAIPEVTRDTKLLKRPLDAQSVNEMQVDMSAPEMPEVPIAKAEDLIDRAYITGITDTTRSGLETVNSVNGVDLTSRMLGGAYWGMQPEQVAKNQAFASAAGAVQGSLNRARLAQSLSPREGVLFGPHGMVGSSPDFAHMGTEIAVPYARQVMSPAAKKALDKKIRESYIPDWVGVDNATNEYLAQLGGKRKGVLYAMDAFRDEGALNLSQIRAIITDPNQFDAPWGAVNAFYKLDPKGYMGGFSKAYSSHPSYPSSFHGEVVGATAEAANILDFNPLMGTADTGQVNFIEEMARRRALAEERLGAAIASGDQKEIGKASAALKGYDIEDDRVGSSVQAALKAGGHGVINRDMVDDLIRRGLILP